MGTRVASGRDAVAGELRAAAPLARRLRAPGTARAPWLTAVLNVQAAQRRAGRPVAVVVDGSGRTTAAAAFLTLRRRGPVTAVTLLGDGLPVPPGGPTARLLAADEDAAAGLADGIADLLGRLRGPWSLHLAGLPLGDPTARRLAARWPAARMATARTTRLVDALDDDGAPVRRSSDPREIDRLLPALLAQEPDHRHRAFLRAAARLHAAAGRLEVAVTDGGPGGLLTLVEDADRRPWWAPAGTPGVRTERGAPSAGLSLPLRSRLPAPDVARRLGSRRP
ncbi:hypothetical protein JKP75_15335 [Blastococcus sp. TML/M2B]|uniref:hypothetical protein n=1 Tax=unclassified Blastococcus TaxID=2619396 RepID=UPI00190CF545|nr:MULTISPECIES: hypothetical protein [unclassified Blastococcus]MBN1093803.1 hypothetical protein [Blastococcus sp. TML/M2B]MBN1096073.1 hypothetical protein [Blastococcus sp. TML/C7B]